MERGGVTNKNGKEVRRQKRRSTVLEIDVIDAKHILDDASGLETCAQNILIDWHVVRCRHSIDVIKETDESTRKR
jgi:hypothetical protein